MNTWIESNACSLVPFSNHRFNWGREMDDAYKFEMNFAKDSINEMANQIAVYARQSIDEAVIKHLFVRGVSVDEIPQLVKDGRLERTIINSTGDEIYSLDGEVIFTHYGRRDVSYCGNEVKLTTYYR
ncbi:hypothetical protein ACW5WK_02615 [Aeromonas enteropelogenes]|uniref:hypothetical protein n=1 Tax=Aeromonas enteropelogenes TaxID=29489 RepID=UPI0005A93612|nr:hypothetical protein [Aeromonas enteropelogenes]UBH56269.1 hypothetical protein LA341_20745 [Aeromonas enteropelogenes]